MNSGQDCTECKMSQHIYAQQPGRPYKLMKAPDLARSTTGCDCHHVLWIVHLSQEVAQKRRLGDPYYWPLDQCVTCMLESRADSSPALRAVSRELLGCVCNKILNYHMSRNATLKPMGIGRGIRRQ